MKIKKAQKGAGVPKGYVRGEMTGKLYKESEMRKREDAFAKELQKQKDYNDSVSKASKKPKPAAAPKKKLKAGGKVMLKRKDGSVSQRGLWDNIRAAKGSGKKPTAAMLKQEKKIKAKSK